MKKSLLLLLLPLAVLVWWLYQKKTDVPTVPFARTLRETLTSTLPTNGKVEPIQWQAVRAEKAGLVSKTPVEEGQAVKKGATLAVLSDTGMQADLDSAGARLAQARAELDVVDSGGKPQELTGIENDLARARMQREHDEKQYASLRRLLEKQAATRVDVDEMKSKLDAGELSISALEKRRMALVSKSDKSVAQARVRDAEAAVELARTHMGETVIHAPIDGSVYDLAARPGVYLNIGDLVANVGQMDRLRVRVYVDEPELGRVQVGQPVTITWDALPSRTWQGTVERKPANIIALGTRQVGEVLCTIDNAGADLVPGTHVDASIRTATVQDALTIPKECLRRDARGVGVFVLHGDKLAWQPVVTGVSSVTRLEIKQGLQAGDAVALPTEGTLKAGARVNAVYP